MSAGAERRPGPGRRGGAVVTLLGALLIAGAVAAGLALLGGGRRTPRIARAPAPALPAPAHQQFGINVNRLFNDLAYSSAQIAAQLAAVHATGVTLARSDALWGAAEPRAPVGGHHSYVWSFDDQIAGSLAAAGLTWLPILDYSAPWAESIAGQDHSPPRSDAEFAAFAAAFAARYGPGGAYWRAHPALTPAPVGTVEVWNEPDNGQFWPPGPNAGAYAALYAATRDAVDAVAPGIRVIVGGLVDPAGFLPAMLAAAPRLAGHIDGVAIHPYGRPAVLLAKVRGARAALDGAGLHAVPLYVTEFGWTTDPPGAVDYAPADRRPGYITAALDTLSRLDCGVAASVLYTWVTPRRDPASPEDWYGIADPADPSAATGDTTAFTAAVHAATAPSGPAIPCAG